MSDELTIAVIPARGGSKRIPRKNIRPFLGTPLIMYPIRTLLSSGLFDQVLVTTDDDEIADVAEWAGALVPFRRSPELSDDFAPTAPVVLDAVDRFEEWTGNSVGDVCIAYPAAVFVTAQHLTDALVLLHQTDVDVVMTVAEFPAPIRRAWRRNADGSAEMIWPEFNLTRSQDLEPAYFDAGQFYWWSRAARMHSQQGLPSRYGLFELPADQVCDIDNLDDWTRAEAIARRLSLS